jgi:hypothetical protein
MCDIVGGWFVMMQLSREGVAHLTNLYVNQAGRQVSGDAVGSVTMGVMCDAWIRGITLEETRVTESP